MADGRSGSGRSQGGSGKGRGQGGRGQPGAGKFGLGHGHIVHGAQRHHLAAAQGLLERVLPEWCLPPQTAFAVFPGRRLMPAKTRVFI